MGNTNNANNGNRRGDGGTNEVGPEIRLSDFCRLLITHTVILFLTERRQTLCDSKEPCEHSQGKHQARGKERLGELSRTVTCF